LRKPCGHNGSNICRLVPPKVPDKHSNKTLIRHNMIIPPFGYDVGAA
jgi:hypothetical protein